MYNVVSSRKTDEGIKNLCLAASKGECIRKEILSNLVTGEPGLSSQVLSPQSNPGATQVADRGMTFS